MQAIIGDLMQAIIGDFWNEFNNAWFNSDSSQYDGIVCTINQTIKSDGSLVMGAGIAKQFAAKFPFLPDVCGERVRRQGCLCLVNRVAVGINYDIYAIGLPTKIDWRKNSTIDLVIASLHELNHIVKFLDLKRVLMTRPGCGYGGLSWAADVQGICHDLLDDRFTIVSIK